MSEAKEVMKEEVGTIKSHAMAMMEAQGRLFVPNLLPRPGLWNGDVVALHVGKAYLAVLPVGNSESNQDETTFVLMPFDDVDEESACVHLDVVRRGEWIGLKSHVAGGKLLQARRKGAYRMAFYSERFGVYEQWEMVELQSLESIDWNVTTVTLRNRKLPSCEIRVRMSRLGIVKPIEGESISRSLGAGIQQSLENQNIQTVTGMVAQVWLIPLYLKQCDFFSACIPSVTYLFIYLYIHLNHRISSQSLQEWINFVEKEQARRFALEARVEKAVEGVDDLCKWAAEQVQCARRDVQEEIESLLCALNDKSAELADVQERLTRRLRWGAALLEAKKATILGRRVLLSWRSISSRSKYCKNAVEKLQKRSQVRAGLRALQAWGDRCIEQAERQRKLRVGVRRMAVLKMQHAFTQWRRESRELRMEAQAEATLQVEAELISQAQRAKHAFLAWRSRSARAKEANRILAFAACRSQENLLSCTLVAWKERVAFLKQNVSSFEKRIAARHDHLLASSIIRSWRTVVDDLHGVQAQSSKAIAFNSQNRLKTAFFAWKRQTRFAALQVKAAGERNSASIKDLAVNALCFWREYTVYNNEKRDRIIDFVRMRSTRCMIKAMWFWKEHTAYNLKSEAFIKHYTNRRKALSAFDTFSWWRDLTRENKMHRHFVSICNDRKRQGILKGVFQGWRQASVKSTKSTIALMNYTEIWARRRLEASFYILQENAKEEKRIKGMLAKASNWHSTKLLSRTFFGLKHAKMNHDMFIQALEKVHFESNRNVAKKAWSAWMHEYELFTGRQAQCANFQQRRKWHTVNQCFSSWKKESTEERKLDNLLVKSVSRISSSRISWFLDVWRLVTYTEKTDKLQEHKAVQWRERKIKQNIFASWAQEMEQSRAISSFADRKFKEKQIGTKHSALLFWKSLSRYNSRLDDVAIQVMDTYATRLQSIAFQAWRTKQQESSSRIQRMKGAISRLAALRAKQALSGWRQVTSDLKGHDMYLGRMDSILARQNARKKKRSLFDAWRDRVDEIQSSVRQFEARSNTRMLMKMQYALQSWRHIAHIHSSRRETVYKTTVEKRKVSLLLRSWISWRHESQMQSRHSLVMLHAVERLSYRTIKESFYAWRSAAKERKDRRKSIIRLISGSFKNRIREAFVGWRNHTKESILIRKNLERCILQKKVAFESFSQWYWDSMDDQLQQTLGSMFKDVSEGLEMTEENNVYRAPSVHCTDSIYSTGNDMSIDLDAISDSFTLKGNELMSRVKEAIQRAQESPGRPLSPPRQELNIFKPLTSVFNNTATNSDALSLSDARSLSSFDEDYSFGDSVDFGSDVSSFSGLTGTMSVDSCIEKSKDSKDIISRIQKYQGESETKSWMKVRSEYDDTGPDSPLILAASLPDVHHGTY